MVGQQPVVVVEIVVVTKAKTAVTFVERGHQKGSKWHNAKSQPGVALRARCGMVSSSSNRRSGSGSTWLGDLATSSVLFVGREMRRRGRSGSFLLGAIESLWESSFGDLGKCLIGSFRSGALRKCSSRWKASCKIFGKAVIWYLRGVEVLCL